MINNKAAFVKRQSVGCPHTRVGGSYGPNDNGYINHNIREAAQLIRGAIELYCEGHYSHSNARDIPIDHGLVQALYALKAVDQDTAVWANHDHEPDLFIPYKPSEKSKHRWDRDEGPVGPPLKERKNESL